MDNTNSNIFFFLVRKSNKERRNLKLRHFKDHLSPAIAVLLCFPSPVEAPFSKSFRVFVPFKVTGSVGVALHVTLHPHPPSKLNRRNRALCIQRPHSLLSLSHISKWKKRTQKDVFLSWLVAQAYPALLGLDAFQCMAILPPRGQM